MMFDHLIEQTQNRALRKILDFSISLAGSFTNVTSLFNVFYKLEAQLLQFSHSS